MYASRPLFSAILSASDEQSGEREVIHSLFNEDSTSAFDHKTFDAFNFGKCASFPNRSDDGNAIRRCEGLDKKSLQRVTERERRKDMKSRFCALTSLLPEQKNRGKTSIMDHLSEATDYIRHLQQKVEQLERKRDVVKMNIKRFPYKEERICNLVQCHESDTFPLVHISYVGSSILIKINTFRDKMVLSKLLHTIEGSGLQVLNAASFASEIRVFHSVHSKILDTESFKNGAELRQKLLQLVGPN